MIGELEVDAHRNSCAELLIDGMAGSEDLGTDPAAVVSRHQVWNQRVELAVRLTDSCFARLAYASQITSGRAGGLNCEPLKAVSWNRSRAPSKGATTHPAAAGLSDGPRLPAS